MRAAATAHVRRARRQEVHLSSTWPRALSLIRRRIRATDPFACSATDAEPSLSPIVHEARRLCRRSARAADPPPRSQPFLYGDFPLGDDTAVLDSAASIS